MPLPGLFYVQGPTSLSRICALCVNVSNKAMRRLGLGWGYSVLMILYVGADLDEEKRNPMEYRTIIQDVIKEP